MLTLSAVVNATAWGCWHIPDLLLLLIVIILILVIIVFIVKALICAVDQSALILTKFNLGISYWITFTTMICRCGWWNWLWWWSWKKKAIQMMVIGLGQCLFIKHWNRYVIIIKIPRNEHMLYTAIYILPHFNLVFDMIMKQYNLGLMNQMMMMTTYLIFLNVLIVSSIWLVKNARVKASCLQVVQQDLLWVPDHEWWWWRGRGRW